MTFVDTPNLIEKSNDNINNICNEYYYHYSVKTKGIHTSKNRNFSKLKEKKPNDWSMFVKLEKLCRDNDVNYKEYIPYAMDEIKKIHPYIKLVCLLNIKYLRLFKESKEIDKQYETINHYICISYKKILLLCREKNFKTFSEFIKSLIKEKKLGQYIKGGIISKYILVLIPNLKQIKQYFDTESIQELDHLVINKYDKYLTEAITALNKFNNQDYINIVTKFNKDLSK